MLTLRQMAVPFQRRVWRLLVAQPAGRQPDRSFELRVHDQLERQLVANILQRTRELSIAYMEYGGEAALDLRTPYIVIRCTNVSRPVASMAIAALCGSRSFLAGGASGSGAASNARASTIPGPKFAVSQPSGVRHVDCSSDLKTRAIDAVLVRLTRFLKPWNDTQKPRLLPLWRRQTTCRCHGPPKNRAPVRAALGPCTPDRRAGCTDIHGIATRRSRPFLVVEEMRRPRQSFRRRRPETRRRRLDCPRQRRDHPCICRTADRRLQRGARKRPAEANRNDMRFLRHRVIDGAAETASRTARPILLCESG